MLSHAYPTPEQVAEAYPHELQEWHENLPVPRSEEDREVLDAIWDRYQDELLNN